MTNHFTQEEARAALAQVLDALEELCAVCEGTGLTTKTGTYRKALTAGRAALAAVDAKLAKAGEQTRGEDWSREQRHALNEGACAIRQLIREGYWAERSEAIAATLDSIRTTYPQASEPALSTAGEREKIIAGLLEAVKFGGTRTLFQRAAALLQSTAMPSKDGAA